MSDPIITLTTDFGDGSPYVAAVKGVILAVNPDVRIIDLSHHIRPHDVRHAAFFVAHAIPYFPRGAIHVVVVDPGVGSERKLLYVESNGQRLLTPDNGCWTYLANPLVVRTLEESKYWRASPSPTFQGRDILAPVAGWLSRGLDPAVLGPATSEWTRLILPVPRRDENDLIGEVIFVDHFGNLITNISGESLADTNIRIRIGAHPITRRVRTYADAEPGTGVALISSSGTLEIAVVQGSAVVRFAAGIGTPVRVSR